MNSSKKHTLGIVFAAILVILSLIVPPFGGLSRSAMYLLGVFLAVVLLWMTVGVTWPSALSLLLLYFLPEASANSVISASVGNPTVTFLIFTFACSWALEQTQFIKRCAVKFLSVPVASRKPWIFLLLYFLSIVILGSFMSTTVIVLIYLTINEEIFSILGLKKGDKLASMMTMGLIIASAISGAVTPIAHVFPLMAMSLYEKAAGTPISYIHYMAAAVPAGLLSMLFMMGTFKVLLKPDVSCLKTLDINIIKNQMTPADRKEKITVAVFLGVCVLWIFPELLKGLFPTVCSFISGFGNSLPPLIGCVLLCMILDNGKPIMNFPKALSSISWVSIFMAASALCIGSYMSNADIGLTAAITGAIQPVLSNIAPILFVIIMIVFTGFLTNVASNMVIVVLACTIAIPIATAMGTVNVAALTACIGMASAYAFATPPAMTTVALGLGSGWMTTGDMAKYGFTVLTGACILMAAISYPIAAALM